MRTLKEGEITGLPYQYKDENGAYKFRFLPYYAVDRIMSEELLLGHIREKVNAQLEDNYKHVRIEKAQLRNKAGMMGAAYLAGLAVGYWESKDEIKANHIIACKFVPDMEEEKRAKLLDGWHKAVQSTSVHVI